MSDDSIFIICITILVILTVGDPDIIDMLIKKLG